VQGRRVGREGDIGLWREKEAMRVEERRVGRREGEAPLGQ
jgi:hypothetical protein